MKRHARGFTLVEILIAISIFGMVIGLAYSSYNASFRIINSAEGHAKVYAQARTTLERIIGDLESFSIGKEMLFFGETESVGSRQGSSLEFTSTAHIQLHPDDTATGTVVIRYSVQEDEGETDSIALYRQEYPLLDEDAADPDNPGLLLCRNLQEVIFSYRDKDGQEQEEWGKEDAEDSDDTLLPRLITISLRFNDTEDDTDGTLFQTAISLPAAQDDQTPTQ